MTRARLIATIALTALVLLAAPAAARAQGEPRFSVAGAYTFLQQLPTEGFGRTTYLYGWMATAAHRLGAGRWSAVGEFGISYHPNDFDELQLLMGVFGGARVALIQSKRVTVFAQGLAGYERFSEPGLVDSGFAVQPGGGLDIYLSSRVFIRAQGDYRWSQSGDATINAYRIVGGIGVAVR